MDINILLALQDFRNGPGGFLADFLSKMTYLGEMNTALVIIALVYWCVSKKFGTYLLMGWSGNRLVNGFLKVTACAYRPWIRDSRIIPFGDAMTTATGYSFPSGHTMNAASVYGGVTVRSDMPGSFRAVMGIFVVLVAFSRNYLGVHTPQDVLVGSIVGMLVMWLIFKLIHWLDSNPDKALMVVVIGIGIAVLVAVYASLKSYPTDYDVAGNLVVDGAKMANDTFKGVGWAAAFLTGWLLERRYVGFSTEVPMLTRMIRMAYGLLSYYIVSLILVPLIKNGIAGTPGTVISCFLQMFYISFIFPWCINTFEKKIIVMEKPGEDEL